MPARERGALWFSRWPRGALVTTFLLLTFSFSWGVWWLTGTLLAKVGAGWRIVIHTIGLAGPPPAALVAARYGVSSMSRRMWRRQVVATLIPRPTEQQASTPLCYWQ
jgi:hypothetical protein